MGGGKRAKARRCAIMAKSQKNGVPRCTYCGVQMSRRAEHYSARSDAVIQFFTMDHIIPRASGGCNDQRNPVNMIKRQFPVQRQTNDPGRDIFRYRSGLVRNYFLIGIH